MNILIDNTDVHTLQTFAWHINASGYIIATIDGVETYLHRYILGAKSSQVVDHINRNKLDNRRVNLRICTQAQNNCNKIKTTSTRTSQYKGVSYRKSHGLFQATINKDRVQHHLGYFVSEHEAALAYNFAAVRIHGPFAALNTLKG